MGTYYSSNKVPICDLSLVTRRTVRHEKPKFMWFNVVLNTFDLIRVGKVGKVVTPGVATRFITICTCSSSISSKVFKAVYG